MSVGCLRDVKFYYLDSRYFMPVSFLLTEISFLIIHVVHFYIPQVLVLFFMLFFLS